MNQKSKTGVVALALALISIGSFAQGSPSSNPKWVSDSGYWIVESNIHTPLNHIIWFYNNDNVLVYKEIVTGVKLNPARRKVKMKLKKVLEASLVAWDEKGRTKEDGTLVKTILR